MKLILCLSAVLLLFTTPAFSELTVEDLEKIQGIVEKAVKASEQRLTEDIAAVKKEVVASEQRMQEYTSHEIAKVNIKIEAMDKRLTGEIKTLGERLNHIFMLVLALVAFIAVVVGVPQIVVAMQQKNIRAQDEKIELMQKQIEFLQRELETSE